MVVKAPGGASEKRAGVVQAPGGASSRAGVVKVVVLGSTGSIGTQALDVIGAHPDRFAVVGLAAGSNAELLAEQCRDHHVACERTVLASQSADPGADLAAVASASEADVVLNAVVGFAGLPATLAALRAGKRLALANKESLIAGGPVVAKARADGGGEIVPVDSEHSAIYQCLRAGGQPRCGASCSPSGGPFRGRDARSSSRTSPSPTRRCIRPGRWVRRSRAQIHRCSTRASGDRGARAVRRWVSTPSTWWCTHSRSCTRWSSTWTAQRSPSCRCPTCACRSGSRRCPRPTTTPSAPWTSPRRNTLTLRPPYARHVPRPRLAVRRRPGRRHRARDPFGRQRGGIKGSSLAASPGP